VVVDHESQRQWVDGGHNGQFSSRSDGLWVALNQESRWRNMSSDFDARQFGQSNTTRPESYIAFDEDEGDVGSNRGQDLWDLDIRLQSIDGEHPDMSVSGRLSKSLFTIPTR
tara:strand:- start:918 stop:1253 length:336 start_codon:yes stop_codon:yes gene_type:complete